MANKQVRLSKPVLDFLATKTKGFETPDQVLRRILKIDTQKEKSVYHE